MQLRFVLLLIIAMRVQGCSCGGNWPSVNQAWRDSPFVFLGIVEIADPDRDGRETMFQDQFVRIRVDEPFKNVFTGQTIELHQGGNDCAAKFRTGQRLVFYLYSGRTPGSWFVPPCGHSLGNAAPSGDDLLFLRKLPKSAAGTRFSGEVELYEDSAKEAFRRVAGVPNVSVKISGRKGSIVATTNVDGVYEVYNLLPGEYSVSITAPKGYRIAFPVSAGSPSPQSKTLKVSRDETEVELTENGGVSVDFVLKADTRLSGRILDANSLPIKDVCIDLEPLEGRGENGARFFDCSKANGAFEMEMMPPGRYWLIARDEIKVNQLKSKSTLYYPGMRDRDKAKIVSVELGKFVEHLDITLPSNEKRHQFTGRMEFADGGPAAYATVTFTSSQHGYGEITDTGPDGLFGLSVIAGMEGQLDGELAVFEPILRSCPELKVGPKVHGLFHFMDASSIALASVSNRSDLKLVVSSPSCKAWPPARN
jgi:hypothetical protein